MQQLQNGPLPFNTAQLSVATNAESEDERDF